MRVLSGSWDRAGGRAQGREGWGGGGGGGGGKNVDGMDSLLWHIHWEGVDFSEGEVRSVTADRQKCVGKEVTATMSERVYRAETTYAAEMVYERELLICSMSIYVRYLAIP